MTPKDNYQILKIPRDADFQQIRTAYRKLALECHPDKFQGSKAAEERFKQLNEAYLTLSNEGRKKTPEPDKPAEKNTPPPPENETIHQPDLTYCLYGYAPNYSIALLELTSSKIEGYHTTHPTYTPIDRPPKKEPHLRPFTLKETIEAKVIDYHSLDSWKRSHKEESEEIPYIWSRRIGTCTSIVGKAKSTKFKIDQQSYPLLNPRNFLLDCWKDRYISLSYNQAQGVELDTEKVRVNHLLTPSEVLTHKGWITVVEEDIHLLKEYTAIAFSLLKKEYGMPFFFFKTQNDELRAINIGAISQTDDPLYTSALIGHCNLNENTRFIQRFAKDQKNPPQSTT